MPSDRIGQVLVRQVDEVALHVVAGQVDKILADDVAGAARARMQHHPHVVVFIETYLDEMIAGAERTRAGGPGALCEIRGCLSMIVR